MDDDSDSSTDSADSESTKDDDEIESPPDSFQLWALLARDGNTNSASVVSAYGDKEKSFLSLIDAVFQHAQLGDEERYLKLSVAPFFTERDMSASELHDLVQEIAVTQFSLADLPPRTWKTWCNQSGAPADLKLKRIVFAQERGCYAS